MNTAYQNTFKRGSHSGLECFNLAMSLVGQRQISSALELYQKAVEADPAQATTYSDLAIALKKCGVSHDDLISLFYEKALFFTEKKMFDIAIAYCHQGLRIDLNHAYLLFNIAQLYEKQDKLGLAQSYYHKTSISSDFSSDSKTLAVFMSARNARIGRYTFHFTEISRNFNIKKIFLRDVQDAWYNKGLPGITQSIDGIATYLQDQISQQNIERVILLGPSAGGYASLLLGHLLEVDEVHAFCPQTLIKPRNEEEEERLKNVNSKYLDLTDVFKLKEVRTKFHIYFDNTYQPDAEHAERMKKFSNVKLYPYEAHVGHLITGYLKDQGILEKILLQALV